MNDHEPLQVCIQCSLDYLNRKRSILAVRYFARDGIYPDRANRRLSIIIGQLIKDRGLYDVTLVDSYKCFHSLLTRNDGEAINSPFGAACLTVRTPVPKRTSLELGLATSCATLTIVELLCHSAIYNNIHHYIILATIPGPSRKFW